jgi:hypothetical protein
VGWGRVGEEERGGERERERERERVGLRGGSSAARQEEKEELR